MKRLGPLILTMLLSVVLACSPHRSSSNAGSIPSNTAPQVGPATTAPAQNQNAEGGWESSGGDGVACFASSPEADQARQELKANGYLSPALRAKIQTVTTRDAWDYVDLSPPDPNKIEFPWINYYYKAPMHPLPALLQLPTSRAMFDGIVKWFTLTVPLFAERLESLDRRFPLSQWEASTQVPRVDDATPQRPIPAGGKCVLIQLANRFTKSTPGQVPETKIVYDQELFNNKLSRVDQALLLMHEYLYEIAKEGGEKNSDAIRPLNALLFALAYQTDQKLDGASTGITRDFLSYPYHDYARYFLKDAEFQPSANAKAGTQESRYNSLISLLTKMRPKLDKCLAGNPKRDIECVAAIMIPMPADQLTLEEAFLFVARFYVEDRTKFEFNSEMLSVRELKIPATEPSAIDKQLAETCRYLHEHPSLVFAQFQTQAELYCRDTLKFPMQVPGTWDVVRKSNCKMTKDQRPILKVRSGPEQSTYLLETAGGLLSSVDFPGKLVASEGQTDLIEYGSNTREFTAAETYTFTVGSGGPVSPFVQFLQLEPSALAEVKLSIFPENGPERDLVVTGKAALDAIRGDTKALDPDMVHIASVTLKFPICNVLETPFPFEPGDAELENFFLSRELIKDPKFSGF